MLHRSRHLRRTVMLTCTSIALACSPASFGVSPGFASSPITAATTDAFAKRGDRSLDVAHVQLLLMDAGIAVSGGADGIFGPGTEAAVKQYQRDRGLPASGVVDEPTAIMMGLRPATAILAQGSHGARVSVVQTQLLAVGITVRGGADGIFGPGTAKAVQTFQGSRSLAASGVIDAATAAILAAAAAATPSAAATATTVAGAVQVASFPVPTTCKYWDTWHAPRSGGRRHEGVDIAAASGTEIYAVQDGRISRRQADHPGSRPGNALWLTAADGTYYFYGHLSAFAKGVGVGSPVRAGDVIGYVGSTGNAQIPHLHLEVHPGGGGPVNPYPILRAASDC